MVEVLPIEEDTDGAARIFEHRDDLRDQVLHLVRRYATDESYEKSEIVEGDCIHGLGTYLCDA